MNSRFILKAGVFAVVGAVVNHRLAHAGGDLASGIPGEQQSVAWRGMDIEYTSYGDPADPDVVCLHRPGIDSSSFEFRPLANELAEDYHVIAPDLPGYGRSARPPLWYSGDLYEAFLQHFLTEIPEDPLVIASGHTGGYAATVANDVDMDGLVLICPPGRTEEPVSGLQMALRTPVVGTAAFNALTAKPVIRHRATELDVFNPGAISPDQIGYRWQTTHQQGARFAPAAALAGYLEPTGDLASQLAEIDTPSLLLWGPKAPGPPLRVGKQVAETAGIRLVSIAATRRLPHAEQPGAVADLITDDVLA